MIALKKYRKLDDAQFLEIVAETDAFKIAESERLAFGLIENKPEHFFAEKVLLGEMLCFGISYHGETLYRIFCQRNDDCLHVCFSVAASNRQNQSVWGDGVEKIASALCCKSITFSTARLAHIEVAKNWGAQITGVTMKKDL